MTFISSRSSSLITSANPAIQQAVKVLCNQQLLAYPTEAVWGLGCCPNSTVALQRLLELKQRPAHKGLILIAGSWQQLDPWLADLTPSQLAQLEATWPGPQTWLLPDPNNLAHPLVKGKHAQVALRLTAHSLVQELCLTFGGPLVSTSANLTGQEALTDLAAVKASFTGRVGYILEGKLGGLSQPTPIKDLTTCRLIRN